MCGIVAQLGGSYHKFADAVDLNRHRGVRTKVYESRWGRLAHARLPIVGVGEENDQPVVADGWAVAFVGEVLDFRDESPGHLEDCDLHTVARGWLERRERCLVGRDGFWSVVALDETTGELHILVDYLAQKAMYYRPDVRGVASEPDACAALGPTTPDEIYFAAVAKWGYCPETCRTPYLEIRRTLPGEHVVMGQSWSGEFRRDVVDPLVPRLCTEETASVLEDEIVRAVERRVLSSDVPVAILYSGGLDSSIVRCVAELFTKKLQFYSAGPESLMLSDRPGDAIALDWSYVSVEKAVRYMQEPLDLGSVVPQVAMSDAVQERVCLTGDGADELFGGYGRAQRYDSQRSDVYHELVGYHLPRLDRVMMRNRVEVRSPFLARRVAEIALGLPWELRRGKRILRDLFRDDLPPGRADAPKVPLRTAEVERDREKNSLAMVAEFRRQRWPSE